MLVIAVTKVFFQCARAAKRGGLWEPAAQAARSSLPATGSLLATLSQGFDGAGDDAVLEERQRQTMY